jgi:hypothetical protein
MWLRKVRPSPSMVVAMTALVASTSGIAWAQVRDNSVRSGDIRDGNVRAADIATNAVGHLEIRSSAVRSAEIAAHAVRSSDVRNDALTGRDILESSLGQIPRAAHALQADNADTVGGIRPGNIITKSTVVPFYVRLSFGQKVEFVSKGPVGLEADCRQNITAQGQDELRLLGVTRQDGAFMQGDTPHSGPGVNSDTLDRDTPEDNRTMGGLVSAGPTPNSPAADDDIDTGFVTGPNGEYIGIDETTMYALRVGGSDCLLVGLATVLP